MLWAMLRSLTTVLARYWAGALLEAKVRLKTRALEVRTLGPRFRQIRGGRPAAHPALQHRYRGNIV